MTKSKGRVVRMAIDTTAITASVARLVTKLLKRIELAKRKAYRSTGLIQDPVKEWYGKVTTTDGTFSFNCTSANFKEILHIDPQAVLDSTDYNAQTIASINTMSLTMVTGRLVRGGTVLLGGSGLQKQNAAVVMIKITGI